MAATKDGHRSGIAAVAAGGLVTVALVGPAVWDRLWLALAPAAALLILATRELHAACRPRDGRLGAVGAFVLASAAGTLLVLVVIGTVATSARGVEPGWLALLEEVAGYAILAGAAMFGAAAWLHRTAPRWAAAAFAASLPLGFGLDVATNLFPMGELFFFAGFGFYIGLGLFAVSLIRFGVASRATARKPLRGALLPG